MARRIGYGRSRVSGGFIASAVAARLLLAAHNSHAATGRGGGVHAAGAALSVPDSGTLSCSGLEALWESAGGSSGAAFMAAEIAEAESSGRQYAASYNSNGTVDRGYWQVNSIWGALSTFDAAGNARAAVRISHDGTDWGPWTTYNSGAYQGKC